MNQSKVVIAMYRPIKGKEAELEALLKGHFPTLKACGLTTDQEPYLGRSSDGTILEIFAWKSKDSGLMAHTLPEVGKIWNAAAEICEFVKLSDLKEASTPFPQFACGLSQ